MRLPSAKSRMVIAFSVAMACLILWGCQSKSLASYWLPSSAKTNGEPDWWNLPAFQVKELSGRVIIANDSSTIYLGLYSSDHRLGGRLKGRGLTVWLTNPANKNERIGVHYPLGMHAGGAPSPSDHLLPQGNMPPSEIVDLMKMEDTDLEIVSSDTTIAGRMSTDDALKHGINARFIDSPEAIKYVLTVSIEKAPWLLPGKTVLVELDSPAWNRPQGGRGEGGEGRRGEGGGFGGGRGGGGRHGGGMGGGHRGGPEGERSDSTRSSTTIPPTKAIHMIYTVELATHSVQS